VSLIVAVAIFCGVFYGIMGGLGKSDRPPPPSPRPLTLAAVPMRAEVLDVLKEPYILTAPPPVVGRRMYRPGSYGENK
jgi:hypothetical protein